MKTLNYLFLLRILLLSINSYELFAILLTLFGILSAIQFTFMFLVYYIYRIKNVTSNHRLIINIYITSRIAALVIILYPAYIKAGLCYEFMAYFVCIVLMEICFEIKFSKID